LLSVSGGNSFDFNLKYGSLVILASLGYGTEVILIRYYLNHIPSFTIVVIQSFMMSVPAAAILFLATDYVDLISVEREFLMGMLYVGILALVATAFALILFYRLVKIADPVFSASVTYFIPAVATLWGFIDGEKIGATYFVWVTIILAGVYLVNSKIIKWMPFQYSSKSASPK